MASDNFGIFDAVVLTAVIAAVAFVIAWALSPALRIRIERPKYRLQERFERVGNK